MVPHHFMNIVFIFHSENVIYFELVESVYAY